MPSSSSVGVHGPRGALSSTSRMDMGVVRFVSEVRKALTGLVTTVLSMRAIVSG